MVTLPWLVYFINLLAKLTRIMKSQSVLRRSARLNPCASVPAAASPSGRELHAWSSEQPSNSAVRLLLLLDARASAVRSRRHALAADYGNLL
eukprot:1612608-Pleurochrysis_carterae.AAC.2